MRYKAASLFLLGDVITEEMSFPRYTMIKLGNCETGSQS